MNWWRSFWSWADESSLLAQIVAGLVVALIVAVISVVPKLREPVFAFIRRQARNLRYLRPLTPEVVERIKQEGRDELQAAIDAARQRPIKRARWAIVWDREAGRDVYQIANFAKGSTARHVSIDADSSLFTFLSAADWDDLEGESRVGEFQGVTTSNGDTLGVDFTVTWTDENGDRQEAIVRLHAPAP